MVFKEAQHFELQNKTAVRYERSIELKVISSDFVYINVHTVSSKNMYMYVLTMVTSMMSDTYTNHALIMAIKSLLFPYTGSIIME